jgi:hypothetical protein
MDRDMMQQAAPRHRHAGLLRFGFTALTLTRLTPKL